MKPKKIVLFSLVLALLLTSCGKGADSGQNKESAKKEEGGMESSAPSAADEKGNQAVYAFDKNQRPILLDDQTVFEKGPSKASVPPYKVSKDLHEVENWDQFFGEDQPVEEGLKDLLAKNLFVVRPASWNSEFYGIYENNRYQKRANFVTVDSLLHAYHQYFALLLQKTEKNHLADQLKDLSVEMQEKSLAQWKEAKGTSFEEPAKRNAAFFSVGALLLDPHTKVPEELQPQVSEEVKKISEAKDIEKSSLMEEALDYSQFKPRGYYAGKEKLEAYFRAMQWYGQFNFKGKDESMTRSALLITLATEGESLKKWASIYDLTAFFAGQSDDPGIYEYAALVKDVYGKVPNMKDLCKDAEGFKKFNDACQKFPPPAINSVPMEDDEGKTDKTVENAGFRFMGQRFTVDGAVMQNLIYSKLPKNDQEEKRKLPNALDIPAAMGSDLARKIALKEGADRFPAYEARLKAIREGLEKADPSLWNASLYSVWLRILTPLTEKKGEGYPSFMQNEEWAKKQLETYLGSYTELKHDTVLYSKQVMAEAGGAGPMEERDNRGYVEPEPVIYANFVEVAKKTKEGLKKYQLLSQDEEKDLDILMTMGETLKTISEKELANQTLSSEDYQFIESYGAQLEHFWVELTKELSNQDFFMADDYPAALVTDIATNPDGICLQIGNGLPQEILVLFPIDGKIHMASGAVFSFYQFERPLGERMTDGDWQLLFRTGPKYSELLMSGEDLRIADPPKKPDWTMTYRALDLPDPAY